MPYFLSNTNINIDQSVALTGEEADHILLSRRAKLGDQIKIQGPDGRRFAANITEIKKHTLSLKPTREIVVPTEPAISISLYQSVVATSTLDIILQKAVELGAAEIILFNTQFTATKLSPEKFTARLPRFLKILWEAAKQSERGKVPVLRFLPATEDIAQDAARLDKLFVFDVSGSPLQATNYKLPTVGLVIGPEGGLSPEEISQFKSIPQSQIISLGPLILRADTAAIASLALVNSW